MPDSDNTLEVMKALVVLRRALRLDPSGNAEPKLSVAQAYVVLHLADSEQVPMGRLANQLGISYPSATDLVDRLVAAGWVERTISPQDRRKVLVQLAPSAQKLAQDVLATRRKKVARVLGQLSEKEKIGFVRGIQLLAQELATDECGLASQPPPDEKGASLSIVPIELPR